jgi:hypothetical protein
LANRYQCYAENLQGGFMVKIIPYLIPPLMALTIHGPTEASPVSECKVHGQLAEEIMKRRQEGVPMATLMEAAEKADGGAPLTAVIRMAYNVPRYELQENQQKAIVDFENSIYGACFDFKSKQQATQ